MSAYLDTSVLAAYYCPERLSKRVQARLATLKGPAISSLVDLELHSAVSSKVRSRELDAVQANRIVSLFRVHAAAGIFSLLPLEPTTFVLARDWIARFSTPLRTLDSLHLALAFGAGLPILTSDRILAKAAEALGVDHELLA